jgi:predicted ATPase
VRLPETLADVLLARVEGLSPAAQELLRVAAVAGRRVSHQLLAEAAGRPELEVEGSLREAIAARVSAYTFTCCLAYGLTCRSAEAGAPVRLS